MHALFALLTVILPYMTQIRADLTQRYTTGEGVTVAVIDSGIDLTHPVFDGIAVDTLGQDVTDTCNHGTGVAGIVASIAPNARLLIIRSQECIGNEVISLSDGIHLAADNGADIITLSIGLNDDAAAIREAVTYAATRGVLMIAAAGNGASCHPYYPAAYPSVLGVGGLGMDGSLWSLSNRGYTDLVAPATSIHIAVVGGGWAYHFGTSFATPMVAGVAALVMQMQPSADVRAVLLATARDLGEPGKDALYGAGLVDALAAALSNSPRVWLPAVVR